MKARTHFFSKTGKWKRDSNADDPLRLRYHLKRTQHTNSLDWLTNMITMSKIIMSKFAGTTFSCRILHRKYRHFVYCLRDVFPNSTWHLSKSTRNPVYVFRYSTTEQALFVFVSHRRLPLHTLYYTIWKTLMLYLFWNVPMRRSGSYPQFVVTQIVSIWCARQSIEYVV